VKCSAEGSAGAPIEAQEVDQGLSSG